MEKESYENNPTNPKALLKYAEYLYENKSNKELELLFGKHLKKSYDTKFWKLYINYVQNVSTKKVNISDVYAFVINHFEHSYHVYQFIQPYISSLAANDDNSLVVDRIRKIYHKAFETPFEGIGKLWIEYEKWEASVNRGGSRQIIEQIQSTYTQSSGLYQRLKGYIEEQKWFQVLDVELENPCRLSKQQFDRRVGYILRSLIAGDRENEGLWVMKSIYAPDEADVEEIPESTVVKVWYSYVYRRNLFDLNNGGEIMIINYLSWLIKNEGMEAFRKKFAEMKATVNSATNSESKGDKYYNQTQNKNGKHSIGLNTYIFCGQAEYFQGGSPMTAYEILQEGFSKYPDSGQLCEEYFDLFLHNGEDEHVRPLFKKLGKTARMWDAMIKYEFVNGSIDRYKKLLVERHEAVQNKELLNPVESLAPRTRQQGTREVYETIVQSIKQYDSKIEIDKAISDFIKKLPFLNNKDDLLFNVNKFLIVDLLKTLKID